MELEEDEKDSTQQNNSNKKFQPQIDRNNFISTTAVEWALRHIRRGLIDERGLDFSSLDGEHSMKILVIIERLRWSKFSKNPRAAVLDIV